MTPFKRLAVALTLVMFASTASAFSGGVTTYRVPPAAPATVEKIVTSTATAGAERDATYQRTMRTAQTAAAASKAARGVVRGMLGSVMVIATLATLASDVHGIWTKNPDGTNDLMIPSNTCNMGGHDWGARATSFCKGNGFNSGTFQVTPMSDRCDIFYVCQPNNYKQLATSVLLGPSGPPRPMTDSELEEELIKPGRLPKLLDELDDKGLEIPWPGPEVEDMPKAIELAPRVTTHPDGSKTTERTTLEPYLGPDGKTVNWRKKESVVQTTAPDASGNTTSKETVTTTDKGESKPDDSAPATDTALPGQPKLYEPKYPDGLTGVWTAQKDALKNSSLTQLARKLMPDIPNGGSCPTMRVDLSFSSWANFGTKDLAPPCYVWDWGRVIIIISALILARSLVFGG